MYPYKAKKLFVHVIEYLKVLYTHKTKENFYALLVKELVTVLHTLQMLMQNVCLYCSMLGTYGIQMIM